MTTDQNWYWYSDKMARIGANFLKDKDGYLPILDVKIKINDDGSISRKLYIKPASKGITLHCASHHPRAMKRSVVANEYTRAITNSTSDNRQESIDMAAQKLRNNKYPEEWLKPRKQTKKSKQDRKSPRRGQTCWPSVFHSSVTISTDELNASSQPTTSRLDWWTPAQLPSFSWRNLEGSQPSALCAIAPHRTLNALQICGVRGRM